jgi:hypothetical protein
VTCAALRIVIGACVVAMTSAVHAATPITLPFGDLGWQGGSAMELPLPPSPQVTRPDVTQMRLVIKPQRGCSGSDPGETRRSAGERRQAGLQAAPAAPKPIRLG